MSRYRWVRITGVYPCPDGRKRAVYARWYANRWALAPALSGRTVYAVTMRNRRITGELRGGRFIPDDTPTARRVALETAAPLLLRACEQILDTDGDLYAMDFDLLREAVAAARGSEYTAPEGSA